VKRASRVYLEAYTSILLVEQSVLVSRKADDIDKLGANANKQ
jgi:diphthamide biosynthesis methyltransferase